MLERRRPRERRHRDRHDVLSRFEQSDPELAAIVRRVTRRRRELAASAGHRSPIGVNGRADHRLAGVVDDSSGDRAERPHWDDDAPGALPIRQIDRQRRAGRPQASVRTGGISRQRRGQLELASRKVVEHESAVGVRHHAHRRTHRGREGDDRPGETPLRAVVTNLSGELSGALRQLEVRGHRGIEHLHPDFLPVRVRTDGDREAHGGADGGQRRHGPAGSGSVQVHDESLDSAAPPAFWPICKNLLSACPGRTARVQGARPSSRRSRRRPGR